MSEKYYCWLFLVLLMVSAGLGACSSGARLERDPAQIPANALNRADPGYMQYLEKQAMLNNSAEMASVVSGSGLAWGRPGSGPRADELLRRGGVWVHIHPQSVLAPGHGSPLDQLGGPVIWNSLLKSGVRGIYIAPTGGSGALWDTERSRGHSDNEDVIQYQFARYLGKDDDYRTVARSAASFQGYLGGDIIPAATGIGPDFFLATRDFRNYPGLYCLVEAPRAIWPVLPVIEKDGQVLPLSSEQAALLEANGLVPAVLRQDTLGYLPDSGWAVTGEIRGLDGNLRRWVYRYFGSYKQPVLNWADPSATARQVLNGSVIRQVGIFGNALSGYRVLPFIGLERFDPEGSAARQLIDPAIAQNGVPVNGAMAMEAATNLSRQTRSYGGWSWLRDELPLPLLREFIEFGGPDFALDSVFNPAAEHALLTGDAALLRFMTDEGLAHGIDFKRLVHTSTGHEGVSYLLPYLSYLRGLEPGEGKFDEPKANSLRAKIIAADYLYRKVTLQAREAQAGQLVQPQALRPAAGGPVRQADSAVLEPETDLLVPLSLAAKKDQAAADAAALLTVIADIGARTSAEQGASDSEEAGADKLAAEPGAAPEGGLSADAGGGTTEGALAATGPESQTPAPVLPESGASSEQPAATVRAASDLTVSSPDVLNWDGRLYTTPAGIAVSALGLNAEVNSAQGLTHDQQEDAARGHFLLVFFKAAQPGLLMLSGQDLVGLLPLNWRSLYDSPEKWKPRTATLGTYALLASSQSVLVNSQGLPRGRNLYGPVDIQSYNPESFLNKLGPLLRLRAELGLGEGELAGRLRAVGSGLICLVTKLPGDKGYVISLSNFARDKSAENLRAEMVPGLAAALAAGRASVIYGRLSSFQATSTHLSFTIPGWEGALILVE